ncbi:MAG: peptidoglycan DD-metalloendopeptidase family protein [Alistipes sp.]|nr:peptidoglycan DD-metalloendopeptidase family protein [Alistipes sp.]
MKRLPIFTASLLALMAMACGGNSSDNENNHGEFGDFDGEEYTDSLFAEPVLLYGIDTTPYTVTTDSVRSGETVGGILGRNGISARKVDRLDKMADTVFPLRDIRADKAYTMFKRTVQDSTGEHEVLDYLVYQINNTDYATFAFVGDSVAITRSSLPITTTRNVARAEITSSLWGAIMAQNLPYALAAEVEDIFKWSVDFFGIQAGDSFGVIYDEKFTGDKSVGVGRIYGAYFKSGSKTTYAIPFADDNGRVSYWDYDGKSLKRQMLKAPLKYTRISSKFTHKRLHPVHRVYRPHLGVDYAAPMGTPVHSVADGTVIKAGWGGGGGNTIYIKHAGGLQTGYLHLKSFAKGIKVGSKVSQGQLIGYVGSTGTSTGPHLDYRIWQNGTPIDPLKVTQQPQEPLPSKYRADFELLRDRIISEFEGTAPGGDHVTEDDIYHRQPSDSLTVAK